MRVPKASSPPAKLARPLVSQLAVGRTRLFRQIDWLRRQVRAVWIAAPPGAGKTTLVTTYLAARALAHVWYQVDVGDEDPGTLFHYLGVAVGFVGGRHRAPLPAFTPERRPRLTVFSRRFFEALGARLRRPTVLVFDNYQEIGDDSPLHEAIADGWTALPDHVHVVVLSRGEPPAAFARLRADNALAVVGAHELTLTFEESRAITRRRMDDLTDENQIRRLHEQANGWAAGLVLLSEQGRPIAGDQPRESRALFDYVATEIVRELPPATQEVLLQAALLPNVSGAAATALTGHDDAGRILTDLHRQNMFTVKRGRGDVYQFHPLFRESLVNQARATFPPQRLREIQRRAATVLEATGEMEEAADLLREAQDWPALSRLVLEHAAKLVAQGRTQRLADWLEAIPAELSERFPWMLYWLGACRLPIDLPRAREDFERAFGLFERGGDADGVLLAWCGIVDSYVYEWGDVHPLDKWIAALAPHLARGALPTGPIGARVTIGMFCALMYRQPEHPDLPAWEQRARDLALHGTDPALRVMVGLHLLLYYRFTGEIAKAVTFVEILRPVAEAEGVSPLISIAWYAMAGFALWTSDSNAQCLATVEQGLKLAEAHGVHLFDFMLLAHGVWVGLNSADLDLATRNLERMRPLVRAERFMERAHYHHLAHIEARFRGAKGRAAEHAANALTCAEQSGAPFVIAAAQIGMARMASERGAADEARKHLEAVCAMATATRSIAHEYSAHKALAELGLGDTTLPSLRRCMELGSRHEYMSGMWWHPATMARLCATALRHDIETDYVRAIIRKRSLAPPPDAVDLESWPWAIKVHTLGRFAVILDGEPLRFSGKAQRRPLELLMALVSFGGHGVSESRLAEAVWVDADADAAHVAFTAALARLRRLLGRDDSLVLSNNQLSLDANTVWVDAWTFERVVASRPDQAIALYQGAFLPDVAASWVLAARERMRAKFLSAVTSVSARLTDERRLAEAIVLLERGLEADSLAEELFRRLIQCHARLGRHAEALAAYQRCERVLRAELGINPAAETRVLFEAIRRDQARPAG
jgi:ATP/maltotriose-dependent transcriptional regulator MalT/DNA-binding SARP family transcriptional activator